jgi:hypothetical protein
MITKVVTAWNGLETYTRRNRRCILAKRDREMERLRAARLPELRCRFTLNATLHRGPSRRTFLIPVIV